jgi:hypothetical protein
MATVSDLRNRGLGFFVPVDPSGNAVNWGAQTVLGYQQITDVSSAVGLTVPNGATKALIRVGAQAVRWRDDGTNPTSSVGMPLSVDDSLLYDGNLAAIKFIEQVSGAKLNISYYR